MTMIIFLKADCHGQKIYRKMYLGFPLFYFCQEFPLTCYFEINTSDRLYTFRTNIYRCIDNRFIYIRINKKEIKMPEKHIYSSEYQISDEDDERSCWEENRSGLLNTDKSKLIPKDDHRIAYQSEGMCNGLRSSKMFKKKTVLGKPFEHTFTLATGKMPNSDVRIILPDGVRGNTGIEVNFTSFEMESILPEKLGLGGDDMIASPVVEFALKDYDLLPDYAVVVVPFIGSPADLKVRKFKSDEGQNTIVKYVDVPLRSKDSEDIDLFYTIKESSVHIYTKSFSGFYCTTCRLRRQIQLRCFLFGSYKSFVNPQRYEVRLSMYIADELMVFADYKERMYSNEETDGKVIKKESQLNLPDELTENDIIEATISPTDSHRGRWIHKPHPEKSTPIQDSIQRLDVKSVAEQCKNRESCHFIKHSIPLNKEWHLSNAANTDPDNIFQCVVDVEIISKIHERRTPTSIVIDELQLRQEDRYSSEESASARHLHGLKQYLCGLQPQKKDKVLGSLGSKFQCTGATVEDMFAKLQGKLTAQYLLETVAVVLNENRMFEELDKIRYQGFLPWNVICNNVQRVCEGDEAIGIKQNEAVVNDITTVNQNQGTSSPGNANASECEEALQHEGNMNTHPVAPRRLNDIYPEQESSASTTGSSAIPYMPSGIVRPELCSSQRIMLHPSSNMDNALAGASQTPAARGELSKRTMDSKCELEPRTLPVMEHASSDETDLTTYYK